MSETADGIGHWQDISHCEGCQDDDAPLRAIKMKEGRRRKLCQGCFAEKLEAGEVDPTDPRVKP